MASRKQDPGSMARTTSRTKEFGKRRELHRITITREGYVRSFTISPLTTGLLTGLGALFIVGYIGATAYLVLRDDLIRTSAERQSQLQLSYEDRIAGLRSQIDRLTSRRVLDRKSIEEKVDDLILRQRDIDERQSRVSSLIELAARTGIKVTLASQIPHRKPSLQDDAIDGSNDDGSGIGGLSEPIDIVPEPASSSPVSPNLGLRGSSDAPGIAPVNHGASLGAREREELLGHLTASLERIDDESRMALDVITLTAEEESRLIREKTSKLGLRLAGKSDRKQAATGGPFVALDEDDFDRRLSRAEQAVGELETLKVAARGIPLARPIEGAKISSSYGPRLDPFLRRLAMHTGIDLRAPRGAEVQATAPGTVVSAGRSGGYGLMVEVRHPSGISSRYAHLSRVLVAEGDVLDTGDAVGLVGSTGRSTGPHLHYELRVNGETTDPLKFVRTGGDLASIIDF